jgi:hypothetical protein
VRTAWATPSKGEIGTKAGTASPAPRVKAPPGPAGPQRGPQEPRGLGRGLVRPSSRRDRCYGNLATAPAPRRNRLFNSRSPQFEAWAITCPNHPFGVGGLAHPGRSSEPRRLGLDASHRLRWLAAEGDSEASPRAGGRGAAAPPPALFKSGSKPKSDVEAKKAALSRAPHRTGALAHGLADIWLTKL